MRADAASALRRPTDVFAWLVRRQREDVGVEAALDAIRSACGSVPLGGSSSSVRSRGSSSALTTTASDDKDVFWQIVLNCCDLPASAGPDQRKTALQQLATTLEKKNSAKKTDGDADEDSKFTWQAVASIRDHYYAERKAFFMVRIELLRTVLFVQPDQHPNFHAVEEIVDDLMKEGLLEAIFDEFAGRQLSIAHRPSFFALPDQSPMYSHHQHQAQQAWEVQFLEEEALLRQLLLLALYFSKEKLDFSKAVQTTKAIHSWDDCIVPDVFSSSTLALPKSQEKLHEAAHLGVMASIRMLHQVSQASFSRQVWGEVFDLSRTFFLGDVGEDKSEGGDQFLPSESTCGVLMLAWASVLAHQYHHHRSTVPDEHQLESLLQETLAMAEKKRGFYQLNILLRTLVFADDSQDADHSYPFLQAAEMGDKLAWQLPVVTGLQALKRYRKGDIGLGKNGYRVSIFQHVAADFLNDVLVSLGYLENLENLHQLNAMAKLVSPILANPQVAEQTLFKRDVREHSASDGLAALIHKSKEVLPRSLSSYIRLYTALCSSIDGSSSSSVLRQVLKEFGKQVSLEAADVLAPRLLPPNDYFAEVDETGTVKCKRSFYYGDDQLAIPAGTLGQIVESDPTYVQWRLDHSNQPSTSTTIWDLLFVTTENLVGHIQIDALVHIRESEDMDALASFFEWIVQASRQPGKESEIVSEIGRRWSETRLRHWWLQHKLPSPQDFLPLLFNHRVSLAVLQDASREDLVAWGIRDRYVREQVIAQLTGSGSSDLPSRHANGLGGNGSSSLSFESDGLVHLIRTMLGFLDSFVHDRRADEAALWSSKHFHFLSAAIAALSAFTSVDSCVEVIIGELRGGTEECVNLIIKTSRKLFEYHERVQGSYPVVVSTLDIVMNLVRWFLSREASALGTDHFGSSRNDFGGHEFISAERNWFVGAVEFAIEILSTHESWKFSTIATKWDLTERCFRVVFALLSAKFVTGENSMLLGLQSALRKTMTTDITLVMKLLRSTCVVMSTSHIKNWNSINLIDTESLNGEDFIFPQTALRHSHPDDSHDEDGLYPLSFESELNSPVDLGRLESLVITSLRLIDLLISSDGAGGNADYNASLQLLLSSIDDGGPKTRKSLNLVTLCGGYLAYPVQKRRDITFWSLRILQHASVFLERSDISAMETSSHSLGALFQGQSDMKHIRDTILHLLRKSTKQVAVGKELLSFLTICLEHQPGFLAYLLFDTESDSTESEKKIAKTQQLVVLLERFLVTSEQLLEEATDLFCEVLNFLVRVWKGATKYGLAVHVEIADALRSSTNFWQNLTRALKVRMSLDVDDENVAFDMDLTGNSEGNAANAYRGRSSPYGYLARGFILQIVSYEWHYKGAKQSSHPLVQVLEEFSTEGLYSHWLRTFTRLDYSQSRFAEICSSVQAYSKNSHGVMTSVDTDNTRMPVYQEGLICETALLQWQLKRNNVDGRGITGAVIKRVKWSNLQAAYVRAQNFALGKWKVFMELCCLQAGGASESNGSDSTTNEDTEPVATNRFKRKESMISSPPRLSTRRVAPPSPLDLRTGDSSSNFSGDRTSYGMIQVLSDVISARQADSSLDYFALAHLQHLVELLVSMLHHQLCLVVQKTRDPRYSHTRQRKQLNESRLTLQKSLKLLSLVENTTHNVDLSVNKIKSDMDVKALLGADEMQPDRTRGLWQRLAGDFTEKIDSVGVKLRTSLLTASLLLVRHIVAVRKNEPELSSPGLRSGERDEAQATSILQVKLIHHCMNSIKVCDQHADNVSLRELFQVSWCLFQEILDGFVHTTTTARNQKLRLDSYVTLRPLVTLLEHEQNGLTALFEILIQRFRLKASQSGTPEARAEQRNKQGQALNVLKGLTAVVWNSKNRDLCQRVMVDSSTSELRLLPLLATQLIPLLRAQMEQEQSGSGHHGYVLSDATGEESVHERSVAHEMWCTFLRFVAGLLKLLSAEQQIRFGHQEGNVIWEFIAHGEPLMLSALHPQTRLTRARVEEQLSILCFLSAVSGADETKKQWKQGLPRNFALMMEQSRLMLRRACVLLGSSLSETKKLQQRKTASKSIVGIATSPSAASSLSSFSFSHQTLLHEHLQAVQADDKRHLTEFYRTMEIELAEVARQTSFLLMKWTANFASQDSMVVIDGARYIDEEKLLPLLTFTPPNQALSMSCEPCLGHLCVVMEFLIAQLEHYAETSKHPSNASPLAFGNTVNTCALLFLKTYLLHNEQYEVSKDDQDEFKSFFQRLNERISSAGVSVQAHVDCDLLRHIEQVKT
ncbi:hypothetical protein FI667_g9425, partial [Globisporangium splendens]